MAVKLGINGFGRIGRYLTRLITTGDTGLEIAAINARADNKTLAHLLKYDSCHGTLPAEVSFNDDGILVNDTLIPITRVSKGKWDWKGLGVDIAVETTGTIKDRDGLQHHLDAGAKKSIISAPCATADLTVVMGVNDNLYDPAVHKYRFQRLLHDQLPCSCSQGYQRQLRHRTWPDDHCPFLHHEPAYP